MRAIRAALAWSVNRVIDLKTAQNALFAAVLLLCAQVTTAATFVDPLDLPAASMRNVQLQPLRDIVNTGKRLVAVGNNGLIITSRDNGLSWSQSTVPVSVDLNAVHFSDELNGWAVGHGSTVLHSSDGGLSWQKQLDGRSLESIIVAYLKSPRSGLDEDEAESYLSAILSMTRPGPGQFFMGVWFDQAGVNGYAVGPFGLIMGTQDGGLSWQPRNTQIDNNDLLHLTAIRQVGQGLYVTGERGRVWRLDPDSERFVALETGYEGSLFGVAGDAETLLVFGLRGHVFQSRDQGRTWGKVKSDLQAGVTAGAALPDRQFVLVSQTAQVALSHDGARSFKLLNVPVPSLFTGVAGVAGNRLAVVGLGGVTTMSLK